MQVINFNFFLKITIVPLIFLLSNCANNKVVETSKPVIVKEEKKSVIEKKSCSERSRVTSSSNSFIKFKHDINEVDEYKKIAAEWCDKFSKIPVQSRLKCGSCCDASYRCK
jgi:hypothetical protein